MFNELCRVATVEDLLNSEELIGEDLSDLTPYYEMAYLGDEDQHGNWFWLEEDQSGETDEEDTNVVQRGGAAGRWVWVPANDGMIKSKCGRNVAWTNFAHSYAFFVPAKALTCMGCPSREGRRLTSVTDV